VGTTITGVFPGRGVLVATPVTGVSLATPVAGRIGVEVGLAWACVGLGCGVWVAGTAVIVPWAIAVCTYTAVVVPQASIKLMLVGVGLARDTDADVEMAPVAVGVASFGGDAERKQALSSTTLAIAIAMMIVIFRNMLSSSEIACKRIENDTSTTFLKRQAMNMWKSGSIFRSRL
jgi:hypothetical protein